MKRSPGGVISRVGRDHSSGAICEREEVASAELPELDGAILDGEVITAGHQGLERGQIGEKRVFTVERAQPFCLKTLEGDDRTAEVLAEICGDLRTETMPKQYEKERCDDDCHCGHCN